MSKISLSHHFFKPVQINEPLTDLLHGSQKRFGELLREVCEVSGFTQGKLSREAKNERQRLIEIGDIRPDAPIGSMEQPTISKVMAGTQEPTYYQVYIWLNVIRRHYDSPQFAAICNELDIPLPEFSAELEQELWYLSTFTPPDKLRQVFEDTNNKRLMQIHKSLIEHKEIRWDRAERKVAGKVTSEGRKSSSKTINTRKIAGI